MRFRYVASFRNERDRKATAVEFVCRNRPTLVHPNESPERVARRRAAFRLQCFAVATLSSLLYLVSFAD